MKTTHGAAGILLATALLAGTAFAQYYPGQRDDNNRNNQRPQRRSNTGTVTTEGPARAPEEVDLPPENERPIPATEAGQPPGPENDPRFARAIQNALPAIVRINMPENRRALGFLVAGPDEDHLFVVTSFLAVALENYSKHHWVDVRLPDWTKLEVVGLHNHDELQDLAVILVKSAKGRKWKPLELAKDDPKPKDSVYSVGWRRALVDWAAAGTVQAIEQGTSVGAPYGSQWISTDAIVTQNNVGGPLMDRNGRVAGLCTSPGKPGRGPYLSVPVSRIHELLRRESYGSGRFPAPESAFRWPETKEKKAETFSASRIQAAASAVKRSLDCKTCNGFGYLVSPVYQVDQNTGEKKKTGENRETCEECGGAGVLIKPSIQELLSSTARAFLNADPKIDQGDIAAMKVIAREGFDRAAVNRELLADSLMPSAVRILENIDRHRGEAVTFVATASSHLGDRKNPMIWVKPYDTENWLLTYGADVRSVSSAATPAAARGGPGGGPGGRRRRQPQPPTSSYVLVSGIVKGVAVVEDNNNVFRAPLIEVLDIVTLRP